MPIGILGAMPEEVNILKEDMTDVVSERIASREYYTGMLYGVKTTLVFSRWGKVAATIAATTLITKFNVDSIIFVGVAGAIHDELNIGDIVVGSQLYQHDMDASPLFPKFQIPLTEVSVFSSHETLSNHAEEAAKNFCSQEIREVIRPEILQEFYITAPSCRRGIIASGDSFIASVAQKEEIKKHMPDVLAVEMEGAAIAQVCSEYEIPFTVIRTISDKADHSANIDFPKFISQVARHYSRSIIKSMYEEMTL